MPKIYKLTTEGLKRLIAEEKQVLMNELAKTGFGPLGDVAKKSKETKEVDADEHGTDKVHEKAVDQLKAQKIKEAKLLVQLKKLRESMRAQKQKLAEAAKGK